MPTDEFDFSDLKPQQVDVRLPNGKDYVLKEASEDAFREFRTIQSKGASLNDKDKTISVGSGIGDADSVLLKGCLFEKLSDGKLGPVSLGFVRALPRTITVRLTLKVLGWLNDGGEDAPKGPPPPTSETST